ncbi:MAG: CHAT domain-containing protein [Nitrospiraceae bacterium]|nr:CHAT domain-containing protein [Nitrospiraceae bacterium]
MTGCCALVLLASAEVFADASGLPEPAGAVQEMQQGKRRFADGAFGEAAVHWTQAARLYEAEGKAREQAQALINLAHALQQEGQVKRVQETLQHALQISERVGDRTLTATILGRLGVSFHSLGQGAQAADQLTKALSLAREEKKPALQATLLNDLGNVLVAQDQMAEAIDVYSESKALAGQTRQATLAATAQVNLAMALLDDQQFAESERALDAAAKEVRGLEDSYAKSYGLLNIGLGYDDLRSGGSFRKAASSEDAKKTSAKAAAAAAYKPATATLLRHASDSFVAAAQVATKLGDARAQSFAWGYMGSLLERERRYGEALDFTRKASLAAQKVNAPESLYLWQWQTARLLKAGGKDDEAIAAYQRAMGALKPIRYEYSVGYQGRHHSFRQTVAPFFTEVEDTLLRRAATAQSTEQTQEWLVQVRDAVEASHVAELQDYFRDDCVSKVRVAQRGQALPVNTAVLYPIMLQDRLELVVQTSGGLRRYGVPVEAERLTQEARTFRKLVQDRRSQGYLGSAQSLYKWLVAPLQRDFLAMGVTTLIVVPDGPLRTIPFAALHDGRHFLVDTFAVAVTPSMELTDARPADRARSQLLSMGLTEPVQGFSGLPHVATEVQAIRALYGGRLLMDTQFVLPAVERELKEQNVGIIHIASRGVIEGEAASSYVVAHDEKMSMDRLSQSVGLLRHRQTPVELLTLSATETPVADDRAALGLTGLAVKAGARSALASLWYRDDPAMSELVAEFYRQMRDPSITKAAALQRAQQKMMVELGREHPSYWAPFILISNWM